MQVINLPGGGVVYRASSSFNHGHDNKTRGRFAGILRPLSGLMLAISLLVTIAINAGISVPSVFGMKTMLVISGSMEPTVATGDAVILQKKAPEHIQAGDLITYRAPEAPTLTTHRVLATKEIRGSLFFQTQGDANATPDANLTPAGAVLGTVVLVLPKLGYLSAGANTAWGKVFLIWLPVISIVWREIGQVRRRG